MGAARTAWRCERRGSELARMDGADFSGWEEVSKFSSCEDSLKVEVP